MATQLVKPVRIPILACCVLALTITASPVTFAEDAPSDLQVLRNTVVNMLEAMVRQGLITREDASRIVADAQAKAEAETAGAADDAAKPGDVRVTYVPQVVQDEITAQVKQDVQDAVVADVKKAAAEEGWGVPAALPEWIRRTRWSGDIRVRGESTLYGDGNAEFLYLDFQKVNDAGGVARAGADAFLNTTDNQLRTQVKAGFGAEIDLAPHAAAAIRFGTGNQLTPVTRNQALGNYDRTFPILLEEAWIRVGTSAARDNHHVHFWAGRMPNLYQSTELVWDNDVRFNGFSLQYAWNSSARSEARGLFATTGLYPIDEIARSRDDKYLLAAQLGYELDLVDDLRFSIAGAWYDYRNITGKRNAPGSSLLDYTAPQFVQKGNTLFDIRNDTDPDTELYALAADYSIVDVTAALRWTLRPDLVIDLVANYATNVGYDEAEILQRTGAFVEEKSDAYRVELRVGNPDIARPWAWRAFTAFHYAERDSLLDAFTDSDFHRGGTDAEGFIVGGEIGITGNTWVRLRYLSADEIDGAPLGIDVLQLDLNARF